MENLKTQKEYFPKIDKLKKDYKEAQKDTSLEGKKRVNEILKEMKKLKERIENNDLVVDEKREQKENSVIDDIKIEGIDEDIVREINKLRRQKYEESKKDFLKQGGPEAEFEYLLSKSILEAAEGIDDNWHSIDGQIFDKNKIKHNIKIIEYIHDSLDETYCNYDGEIDDKKLSAEKAEKLYGKYEPIARFQNYDFKERARLKQGERHKQRAEEQMKELEKKSMEDAEKIADNL